MEIQKFSSDNQTIFTANIAGKTIKLETGKLAGQADGSCVVSLGDTVVLATAVMSNEPRSGIDFFPLMVDLEERLYAAGKIKGSRWIKREGRPSDEAVVTTRLVDRSIRPLFPDSLYNDVQVTLTVLSVDNENDSDIAALLSASAALAISRIPWAGPLGGLRVAYCKDEAAQEMKWIINPTFAEREKSLLDMVVAGVKNKVVMIEANGSEVHEEKVFEGIQYCEETLQSFADFISEFALAVGKPKTDPRAVSGEKAEEEVGVEEAMEKAQEWMREHVEKMIFEKPLLMKESRQALMKKINDEILLHLESLGIGKEKRKKASAQVTEFVEKTVSENILRHGRRVDGRRVDEVRALKAEVGLLPRTHGSGLFLRGETQVLSIVTLGAPGEEQMLEGIETNGKKRYMHHYNFPSFCVGEVGGARSPGRREIGHGALAERAMIPVLPTKEEFPYTIRVVSEVLSSNGSSSMASACGSTLSLMDAGVPLKKHVAGVAMGLASDSAGNYRIISDLQDLEDGLGGMDFKVAGTREGITVIQLDTKTFGLALDIIQNTLTQAKKARFDILDVLESAIPAPRAELSPYAPRITILKIDPKKIRDVIGSGGKVINEIVEKTGANIEIEQDGTIFVSTPNQEAGKRAVDIINEITREIKEGEIFDGKVVRLLDFGAIVQITPNRDGMVHISEMAPYRVNRVEDIVKLGDSVKVKVLHVDDQGKVGLSIKALLPGQEEHSYHPRGDRERGPRRRPQNRDYRR